MKERLNRLLNGYFNSLVKDGFIPSPKNISESERHSKEGRLVLYCTIQRMGRTDEEIDFLARKHKIELYLITLFPNISILYNIVD